MSAQHPDVPLLRVEDERLLRGGARFLDDLVLPGLLHAAFLRSPVAHARLLGIGTEAARALPGVCAVFTHADLRPRLTGDRMPLALKAAAIRFDVDPPCLAYDEICYVGEPVAIVIAESRRVAEDAVGLLELAYDILPVVNDPRAALAPGAPKARLDCPDNLVARTVVKYGDADGAFAVAAHRLRDHLVLDKGGGHSIEPRGVVAWFEASEELLTVWDSTQMPHRVHAVLVAALGMPEHQIRVLAPDVGGGFGPKAVVHPEELAVPAAALLLGRPIKWAEDRFESFTATVQERRQYWDMEAAIDAEGRLMAMRGTLTHDHGAATPHGVALPDNAGTNLVGPDVLPACEIDIQLALTNMVPVAPTRGAGRPQGTLAMEHLLDRIATLLGLERDEVRRRNLIPPSAMPFMIPIVQRDGSLMTYDSGDYPECQSRALAAAGWDDFPARQAMARREGRWIGLGLSNYVEATGRGPFESAAVRIGPSGQVVVATGATAQGQGTKTMLATLTARSLGINPRDVHVIAGDTAMTPLGLGAFASRQAVTAGNAVKLAADAVATKARQVAAQLLAVAPEDLELRNGRVQVKGAPQTGLTLAAVAHAVSGVPGFALPGNLPPGLSGAVDYQPTALTYSNGTHLAEVEVDVETGIVRILRYIVVHDCGNIINPEIVEGQVRGGVVHGIGATLFEWMRYDEEAQPLCGTFADYLLPTSDVVPRIEIHHMETPSPLNPLGVKGAAESGTIGTPAALVSAIEDALQPLGVQIQSLPITPALLQASIAAARAAMGAP